ncbi:hypothetical protein C8J57DRAFT_1381066 [Mycena rebaudengoi]|nr:hypothetical protein C8J57DRAFT_1381066 [Mycena rebaudengoi]
MSTLTSAILSRSPTGCPSPAALNRHQREALFGLLPSHASHRSRLLSVAHEGRRHTHRPRALLFQIHTTSAICMRGATTAALVAHPARSARRSSSRRSRLPDDRAPHAPVLSYHAHLLRPASSAVAPPPSPSARLFAARTWADRNRNAGGRGEEDGDVPVDLEVPADLTPGPFRGRRIEQTSDLLLRRSIPLTYSLCL